MSKAARLSKRKPGVSTAGARGAGVNLGGGSFSRAVRPEARQEWAEESRGG